MKKSVMFKKEQIVLCIRKYKDILWKDYKYKSHKEKCYV